MMIPSLVQACAALFLAFAPLGPTAPADAVAFRSAAEAEAGVHLTVEEALALAFPDCTIERRTVYMTDAQRAEAERRLGARLDSGVARPYVAWREAEGDGAREWVGTAWIDSHRVRTLKETLLFAVSPEGRIQRLELLAFLEPPEYIPKPKWYAQFVGRGLDADLELGRAIRPITGATLSARATVAAARRSLAVHGVLFPPRPEHTERTDPTPTAP